MSTKALFALAAKAIFVKTAFIFMKLT